MELLLDGCLTRLVTREAHFLRQSLFHNNSNVSQSADREIAPLVIGDDDLQFLLRVSPFAMTPFLRNQGETIAA